MTPPVFGRFAPSSFQQRIRSLSHKLPYNFFGRKTASLLLGPAGGRSGKRFDVTVFNSQRARLHPGDNICEKRVYMTPQHWDPAERGLLGDFIRNHGSDEFYFADIGANVGLYTLFARAACAETSKRINAICVEADPEMRDRLACNLTASNAQNEIRTVACAAAAQEGTVKFHIDRKSRGMSRIDEKDGVEIPARPIAAIIDEARFPRIDAMKIDIEGQEFPALNAFLNSATKTIWPQMLIMEISHDDPQRSALSLCLSKGYQIALKTRLNAVLVR